jgi:hypothetical protein
MRRIVMRRSSSTASDIKRAGTNWEKRKPVVLRQASINELRNTIEMKLAAADLQRLHLTYQDEGVLPAAAIVRVQGVELRLEKDYFDGCWTIATNEGEPRLLDRMDENQLGPATVFALEQSVVQLRG